MLAVIPRSTQWARNNKERVSEQQKKTKSTLVGKLTNLVTTSKYRCKISKREHLLDVSDLKEIYNNQSGLCALTGIKMEIRGKGCAANSPYSISLDRIDSDKGYIKENVWLVCTGINLMKSRLTVEQFYKFCENVVEYKNG